MKATARANSNIALVKYWGKKDDGLRLPVNSSLAIGLDKIYTTTTVEFDSRLKSDNVEIDGDSFSNKETLRVTRHLDLVRKLANIDFRAKVITRNNFPKGAGAASSASGFAALTLAAVDASGLKLSEKELSIIARQGSGSASRSIPGGLSIWHTADASEESFVESVDYPREWDLRVLLVFVGDMKQKKIGSTEAMELSKKTSPYFSLAVKKAESNLERMLKSLSENDWTAFGQVIEDECYRLHTLCMTTQPNILYWQAGTIEVFQKLYELRERDLIGYFTVDAGPHAHIVCKSNNADAIEKEIKSIPEVSDVVNCSIGGPSELINNHLF